MRLFQKITKNMPVKDKLVLLIISVCIPSIFVCVISLSFINIEYSRQKLKTNLQIITDLTSDHLTAPLAFNDQDRAKRILSSLKHNPSIISGCLYNDQNKIIAKSNFKDGLNIHCDSADQASVSHIILRSDIEQKQQKIGYLEVHASLSELSSFIISNILAVLSGITVVIVFVSFPLANFLQRQISQPIYEILESTKQLSLPEHRDDQTSKTADELLFSLLMIQKAKNELKLHRSNLEKIDTAFNNREILINAFDQKTSEAFGVHKLLGNMLENNPYQNIEALYTYSTGVSSNLDEELESLVSLFRSLHEQEMYILKHSEAIIVPIEIISKTLTEYFESINPSNIDLIYIKTENTWHANLYPEAFNQSLRAVFDLLITVSLKNHQYEMIIKPFEAHATGIKFELKTLYKGTDVEHFDYDHIDLDTVLLRTKYFTNINNTNSNAFMIELRENVVQVTLNFK